MKQCPLCKSENIKENLYEKQKVFTSIGKLYLNPNTKSITSSINLCQCQDCGYIYNKNFNIENIQKEYSSDDYVLKKNISAVMSSKMKAVIKTIEPYINNKTIALEIGCGNGDLSCILAPKVKTLFAVDPAKEAKFLSSIDNILFINAFFTAENIAPYINCKIDVIILRHLLEHIDKPTELLNTIDKYTKLNSVVYIEVPNADEIISSARFYDIFHDHFAYFERNTLLNKMQEFGFELVDETYYHKNQHMGLLFKKTMKYISKQTITLYDCIDFDKFNDNINRLNQILSSYNKIAIYGAGAHGNSILNYLTDENKNKILFAFDRDTTKQDKYLQSSNIQIVEPVKNYLSNIDVIVMASSLYEDEIVDNLRQIYEGDIILTATEIRIV